MSTTTVAQSITASLDRFSAAWNAGGATLGDFFTHDASLINPFGQRVDGPTAISEMYAQYFKGMLLGSTSHIDVLSVRHIDGSYALMDATQTISAPDGSPVLVVHLAALLTETAGTWQFVDSRPHIYASPPA